MASAERPHAQASIVAGLHINALEFIENLVHGKACRHGFKTLVLLNPEDFR